jgi:hypothetical protein
VHIGIISPKAAWRPQRGDLTVLPVCDGLNKESRLFTGRVLVEVLFYLIVVCTNVPDLTPLGKIKYGVGGIIDLAGFPFIAILFFSRFPFPFSLKMAMAMALFVNISNWWAGDLPIVGEESAPYSHWIAWLAMATWLARDEKCARRMPLFFSVFIIGVIATGGVISNSGEHRLHLDEGHGTSFINPNDIAHMSALLGVSCLFLGHYVRKRYRVIYWLAAMVLMGVIVETISRGGMLALGIGLAGFLVWSGAQNRNRGTFYLYLLALFGILAAIVWYGIFDRQFDVFSGRLTTETGRGYVYSLDLFPQLMENLLIGSGTGTIVRIAGYTAHNNFIYNFNCFGGIMAAVYLLWLYSLMKRIRQQIRAEGTWGASGGMLAVLFAVGILSQVLSNQANLFFSFIFVTALIERASIARLTEAGFRPACGADPVALNKTGG